MNKFYILIFGLLVSFILGCSSDTTNEKENQETESQLSTVDKQLNITILLDLSDRIDKFKFPCSPEHYQRDVQIINQFTKLFKNDMEKKGAFNAKGKIKIIFSPIPNDPEINNIVSKLNINLSKLNAKGKKEIFDNISTTFQTNIENIYTKTIKNKKYIGADIWRFFKDDVVDYCIDNNSEYRNILVILTDGYIYHPDSKEHVKNRTSYIGRAYINRFRNNPKWKEKFEKGDYGLIDARNGKKDLKNLEILVLEISPIQNQKEDEDIIKAYLKKWFSEMNVDKYRIYNSDLPEYTKGRIETFMKNDK